MIKQVIVGCLILYIGICKSLMAANIEVLLKGFENNQGQAIIVLHGNEESFPDNVDKAITKASARITNSTAHTVFNNIEPGTYAIAAIHDQNNNGRLDKSFFGIPEEGVGTSGESKNNSGPPKFKNAKFTLNDDKKIVIDLDY